MPKEPRTEGSVPEVRGLQEQEGRRSRSRSRSGEKTVTKQEQEQEQEQSQEQDGRRNLWQYLRKYYDEAW